MPAPIAVQLYSLRAESAEDFPAVLRRVGEIGYAGVELAGFHGLAPAELARICADAGLQVASAHIGILESGAQAGSLDELAVVGCTTAVVPFLPPGDFTDAATIEAHARTINELAALGRSRGIRVGYHNHWWEFQNRIGDRTAWEHLFAHLDDDVFAELDIYWATVGGMDVASFLAAQGDRIRLLHVKDGPANDPQAAMVAVGSGVLDIPGLLGAAPHADWHIVELDRCATDMFTAVADSHTYLTGAGLSTGR